MRCCGGDDASAKIIVYVTEASVVAFAGCMDLRRLADLKPSTTSIVSSKANSASKNDSRNFYAKLIVAQTDW